MARRKPGRWEQRPPALDVHYRDPSAVDGDLGRRRKAAQIGTSFWQWPLWQRYKTNEMLLYPMVVGTST